MSGFQFHPIDVELVRYYLSRKVFGKKLPLSVLYKAANVSEQAEILQREDIDAEWSPLVRVQTKGTKPPLFCFPGKGGNPIRFRHLSQRLGNDHKARRILIKAVDYTCSRQIL